MESARQTRAKLREPTSDGVGAPNTCNAGKHGANGGRRRSRQTKCQPDEFNACVPSLGTMERYGQTCHSQSGAPADGAGSSPGDTRSGATQPGLLTCPRTGGRSKQLAGRRRSVRGRNAAGSTGPKNVSDRTARKTRAHLGTSFGLHSPLPIHVQPYPCVPPALLLPID